MRRALLLAVLAAIVAAPFALRPRREGAGPAQDTVVIVTPNNEAIRHEYELGFESWYRARTGRTIAVDWRVLGGTSEIARLLEGAYTAAFRRYWVERLGQPWSAQVEAAFRDPNPHHKALSQARDAFLSSEVSCGIDVFFGGGPPDFDRQAAFGTLVPSGLERIHPQWFSPSELPASGDGTAFRNPAGLWYGSVLSCYGIIFNRDALREAGFSGEPSRWEDLADPRLFGRVALCDPEKSGSMAMAFENLIQQRIHLRLAAGAGEAEAVRQGWLDGLRLIQRIGANARYFTDDSQKPPVDVADGACAAGMCIDFYGAQQEEAERRRGAPGRVGFVAPAGGTAYFVDPIGLLRGAPHPSAGRAFLEYALSLEGQKLWAFRPGTPGGPRDFALRRLPVRRDFYAREDWKAYRSDPDADPYAAKERMVYHPEWTAALFPEIGFIVRAMCEDPHAELARAWREAQDAAEPARSRALAILQDLSPVAYDRAAGPISRTLDARDPVAQARLASDLAGRFRAQYARAEALARGSD